MIPHEYTHLCWKIFPIERRPRYVIPPNDAWWACLDGLTPCVYNPVLQEHGFCVLVKVIPRLIYYWSDEFFHIWEQSSDPSLPKRSRQESITAVTIAVLLGLGAVGAGTGISSLVLSNSRYHELSATIDQDIQELQKGISDLTDSISSLTEVVLQNRRGLDLLFLQQGGLCATLKEECCFYADKTGC